MQFALACRHDKSSCLFAQLHKFVVHMFEVLIFMKPHPYLCCNKMNYRMMFYACLALLLRNITLWLDWLLNDRVGWFKPAYKKHIFCLFYRKYVPLESSIQELDRN